MLISLRQKGDDRKGEIGVEGEIGVGSECRIEKGEPPPPATASYAYTLDAADRLTQEVRTWSGGASTDTVGYTYTNNDQLTGVTHTNTSFANESFGYDANGNRDTAGYATTAGNRLASDGTSTYGYDDEGNLTSKTAIATGNQTLYTWDYRDRLTEVDQVAGGVHSVAARYTYDAGNSKGSELLVVSGVDSQLLLSHSWRDQPAQVMGHSIVTSKDGPHGPHRALLLSEFPLPRGRCPRR